ncbi:MAG: D-glycero-beta-D-manno-heptose 1,7-bisphosphate 7-phosphatase [Desulfobacterales bacterium]|nr:D-glycero-beta-D-manno-heptose 1,7-bisphosphate 7-phosphatase [Desulfobacterales bacterium]
MRHQNKLLRKVVFLDRDGVINQDSPDYIKNWSEFKFLPRSIRALRNLTLNNFTIIIITNQSAISRKLLTIKALETIHANMRSIVHAGEGKIKDIFFCPHLPENECDCRKPKPGLIYQAQKAYNIDLKSSWMIGDSVRDIECARNAGCGYTILVKTGNGKTAEKTLTKKNTLPDYVAPDLYEASRYIIDLDAMHHYRRMSVLEF